MLDSDPFDDPGADVVLEAMLNSPPPPEATMDPDELAAALFLGSIEFVTNGCPLPEPPDMPALELAA